MANRGNIELHEPIRTPDDLRRWASRIFDFREIIELNKEGRPISHDSAEAQIATDALIKRYTPYIESQGGDAIRPDRIQRKTIRRAKEFVESEIGIQVPGHISLHPRIESANTEDAVGGYNILLNSIFAKEAVGNYPKKLEQMFLGSTVAHEFAHYTAPDKKISVFINPKAKTALKGAHILYSGGMQEVVLADNLVPTQVGEFFEEGFAEETGARYREYANKKSARYGGDLWRDKSGLIIPMRFFDHDDSMVDSAEHSFSSSSAYPAYAISLLSQASNADLFGLMADIRRYPDSGEEIRGELAGRIDSLDSGLFDELNSLQYTREDFAKGLDIVKSIA